jgi:plasmid maintenance system antidote protein VapI
MRRDDTLWSSLRRNNSSFGRPGWIFRERFRRVQIPTMTKLEAAERLGWPLAQLASFERDVYQLTADDAARLEVLTGTSAAVWLALQARVYRQRRRRHPRSKSG